MLGLDYDRYNYWCEQVVMWQKSKHWMSLLEKAQNAFLNILDDDDHEVTAIHKYFDMKDYKNGGQRMKKIRSRKTKGTKTIYY